MEYNIPNNYLKYCLCGCETQLWALVKYGNGRIVERNYIRGHHPRGKFHYNVENPAERTSRRRAMEILQRIGRTICEINNSDCSSKKLESHHIDGNPFNNDLTNLVPLCITHHQLIERRKISVRELKNLQLVYTISNNKRRYKKV